MRVLNIVVEECRTLSSRERCPFLVHLEVAETGLNSNDSQLYASGAPGLGATVEEALAMRSDSVSSDTPDHQGYASYRIPDELLPSPQPSTEPALVEERPEYGSIAMNHVQNGVFRGGWSASDYPENPAADVLDYNAYDSMRQDQIEQLHYQLQQEEQGMVIQPPSMSAPK